MAQFDKLLSPACIGNLQLKNRIVMPPMDTQFGSESGFVTQKQIEYYEERARGGVGLVIVEAACIDAAVGRLSPRQLNIDDDKYIPDLSRLADAIKKHGARAALQINHSGRMSRSYITGNKPVGPSPIAAHGGEPPRELTVEEIGAIVLQFADAAERAVKAGFEAIEIHAAHGYLISEFISPLSNRRKDNYGGSIENRAQLLVEVIQAVRERTGGEFPVWCRLDGVEYEGLGELTAAKRGINVQDAGITASLAEKAGAVAIHVSAQILPPICFHPMSWPKGLMTPLAESVKQSVSVPVIAVGRIPPELGESLLSDGKADLIAMGRALIAQPDLVRKLETANAGDIRPCISCWNCLESAGYRKEGAYCSVNPVFGREGEVPSTPAEKPKTVVVVGGGPAGMEAAITAAGRGHKVALYEKDGELGGQLLLAGKNHAFKQEIDAFKDYLVRRLKASGVEIKLKEAFTEGSLAQVKPDVVILAAGIKPLIPEIPGMESSGVILASDVLKGTETGERVVIIGAEMVACETAELLADSGKKVTMMRRGSRIAAKVGPSVRGYYTWKLEDKGVNVITRVEYEEVTREGVVIKTKRGDKKLIPADAIVLAAGAVPNTELQEVLEGRGLKVVRVGDCNAPGSILEAMESGYLAGISV